ncbi:MAG: HDOD domain-containing protein [Chloroflexi bacterium]|nr:HDOD domain-containing protein [Chloroflexota bacterium]
MLELFIGRQPIFNRRLEVVAYELLYRSAEAARAGVVDGDQATARVLLNAFAELGLDTLVGGKKAYVNITRNFFNGTYPIPMPPAFVTLEVMEDTARDLVLYENLIALAGQGYQIALDDVIDIEQAAPLLSIADVVKIDIMGVERRQLPALVEDVRARRSRCKLLAEKVETHEELEFCTALGFDYFQGYFLCKPVILKGRRVDAARVVILQTLVRILDPRADFRTLAQIVSQDVSLSYKLLKLVNSAFYGFVQRITSIEGAIGLLGMNQLRGWLTLLLMSSIENKPHELTNLAMSRAKLCELIALTLHQPRTEPFFLVGLFSVLDALLDINMAEALDQLPLSDEVVAGLLRHEGNLGEVLQLTLAYERGDWDRLVQAKIEPDVLRQSYVQAIRWTSEIGRRPVS